MAALQLLAVHAYQIRQNPQSGTVNGLSIDVDTTMVDQLGGVPQWWVRAG